MEHSDPARQCDGGYTPHEARAEHEARALTINDRLQLIMSYQCWFIHLQRLTTLIGT